MDDFVYSEYDVYTDLIISTIVDAREHIEHLEEGLYGLDNFYYRR